MTPRPISLLLLRQSPSQRAHFAIFVPSLTNPDLGSLINVVGARMMGYKHVFERGYRLSLETQSYEVVPLGYIDSRHIVDSPPDAARSTDDEPKGDIELAAAELPAPGVSENFIAPVNETTNRRCQEWTMDYIRHLVAKGYIDAQAIEIVQSKRDPPEFGIALRPAGQ
ncbi:hypothetical protein BJY00DRAFT_317938 [Aspergillus carlsbadensis]|nr:hypothetical protein BJY00DRAFT_317938 [Aspergillus carlsbadensis]